MVGKTHCVIALVLVGWKPKAGASIHWSTKAAIVYSQKGNSVAVRPR